MNEKNYDKVLDAIPHWRPNREVRTFGISAIQSVVKCTLKEAAEIKERLICEGALPERKY